MMRSRRQPLLRFLLSCLLWLALGGGLVLSPVPAGAEDKPAASQRKRRAKPKKRKAKKKRTKRSSKKRAQPKPRGGRAPEIPQAEPPPASEGRGSADTEVVKEGDTEVKVMSFSGIDVEGRLKSPQLLYFVNRVRAEFDRPGLPHRSFIPELTRSTHGDELK